MAGRHRTRRRWSREEKRRIVAQTLISGVSVSQVVQGVQQAFIEEPRMWIPRFPEHHLPQNHRRGSSECRNHLRDPFRIVRPFAGIRDACDPELEIGERLRDPLLLFLVLGVSRGTRVETNFTAFLPQSHPKGRLVHDHVRPPAGAESRSSSGTVWRAPPATDSGTCSPQASPSSRGQICLSGRIKVIATTNRAGVVVTSASRRVSTKGRLAANTRLPRRETRVRTRWRSRPRTIRQSGVRVSDLGSCGQAPRQHGAIGLQARSARAHFPQAR